MINYRLLEEDEWERLIPIYCELFPGKPMPTPDLSICAVAEEEGTIKGFLFFCNMPHMEPGGVLPNNPNVHLNSLRILLEQQVSEFAGFPYFCYTQDSQYDSAMLAAGFEPVGVLWSKVVNGK